MRIEVRRTIEQEFKADGWRRCAEGQNTTQFCALLEAAVLAEREECAGVCDALADEFSGDPDEAWFFQRAAAAIRARGNNE
jgi:hypothetical protein